MVFVAALAAFGKGLGLADWRNLALILGGMIALPLAVWRSGIAAKQVALIESGLNTDRYQKGAAMLGDERLSVRQAGVFGLTELAKNNFEEYHAVVMKLFCSFIQDRSLEQMRGVVDVESVGHEITISITPDCQTALTGLADLVWFAKTTNHALQDRTLDLRGAFLRDADLWGAHLEGVCMKDADLTGASLTGAHLTGAYMEGVQLAGANMSNARLKGSSFYDADLRGAMLVGADMREAYFVGAKLENANIGYALLDDTDLSFVNLTSAYLVGASLSNAELFDTCLQDANLKDANLEGVQGLTSKQLESTRNVDTDFLKDLRKYERNRKR